MASHVVVTSSTARSTKVKVTPGTYMSDVLDQACKSLKMDTDNYILKHKQKNVDLTIPFRMTGLAGGAKLELVVKSKSPAPVNVAISLPPPDSQAFTDGRLNGKFPSSFTIWQVLRQIENLPEAVDAKLNITARPVAATSSGQTSGSGQLLYEAPVLNIMGRELSSFEDYQKTLSQLGYNTGRLLIRLVSYRMTGLTFFEAQEKNAQYFQELEQDGPEKPPPVTKSPGQQPTPTPSQGEPSEAPSETLPAVQEQETAAQPTTDAPQPSPPTYHEATGAEPAPQTAQANFSGDGANDEKPSPTRDPLAPVGIFSAPTSSTPAAALMEFGEADFEPTIAHAKLHQSRLLKGAGNKRLPSDKQLAEQAAATEERLSSVQSIEVKVKFPDMTSASWAITHEDTGAKLYSCVRSVMADPSLPFRLVASGSRDVIRDVDAPDNRIIRAHKLRGGVVVNLIWDDSVLAGASGKPFLTSSAAQEAKDIVVPDIPAVEEEEERPAQQKQPQGSRQGGGSGGSSEDQMKKINKFFKLPGRK